MRARLVAVLVIVTGVTLLGLAVGGIPDAREATVAGNDDDDAAVTPEEATPGVTWFCPAGRVAVGDDAVHQLSISNPTGETVSGAIRSWRADGTPGGEQAVELAAGTSIVIDASGLEGADSSVVVELEPAGAVVSHSLLSEGRWDAGPCASRASAEAYFPAGDTRRDATARLALVNPFRSDAVVDVTVSSAEGVRVPPDLSGLVVPGGSSRVIELGEIVQNRDQFALAVVARAGRFVAELAQQGSGSESPNGLRLQLGVPGTVERVAFADGFVAEGIGERYLVFNPTGENARVALAVVPYGVPFEQWPEPFVLDVAARRTVSLDLGAEPRVPPGVGHWVRVEVLEGPDVVVQRLVTITGDNPAGVSAGTAGSTGATTGARRWVVNGLDPEAGDPSSLAVANPSPDTIATVRLVAFREGAETEVLESPIEIAPGDATAIDLGPALSQLAGAPSVVVVDSDHPVVVERRSNLSAGTDLAVVGAFPVRSTTSDLPSYAETLAGQGGS